MGRFIPDLLRAVADGWEQAAGRDPVDQHAAEMAEALDGQTVQNIRVGPVHVFRIWAEGMTDDEKIQQLERELLRVALERDRLAAALDEVHDDDPDEVVVTAAPNVVVDAALHLAEARMDTVSAREQLDMVVANVQRLADFLDKQATAHVDDMVEITDDPPKAARLDGLAAAYRDSASELRSFVGRTTEWTGRPLDAKLAEKDRHPDVQAVVDAARRYEQLFRGHLDNATTVVTRDVINTVEALDGRPISTWDAVDARMRERHGESWRAS